MVCLPACGRRAPGRCQIPGASNAWADAAVHHSGTTIGYFAARQLGVSSILAAPFPMAPISAYPALKFYTAPRLGSFFNLQIHKIFQQVMWLASSDPVRQYWKAQFGHTPPDFANSDGTPKGRIHRSGFGSGGSGGAASLFGAALTASGNRCTRITFKDHRGEII